MKKQINELFHDRLIRQTSILSTLLLLSSFGLILFFLSKLQPLVPLFNQAQWGILRLANKNLLFIPAIAALIFCISNVIIARYITTTMPLVARMLVISAALCSILVFTFLIRTLQLIV